MANVTKAQVIEMLRSKLAAMGKFIDDGEVIDLGALGEVFDLDENENRGRFWGYFENSSAVIAVSVEFDSMTFYNVAEALNFEGMGLWWECYSSGLVGIGFEG